MTMTHTPGPWALRRHAVNHQTLTGDAPGLIADIHDDANARLIAAAPDLLAALRIAREHVKAAAEADMYFARQHEQKHMYGNAAECRKQHDMRLCALDVIDAAIALAAESEE